MTSRRGRVRTRGFVRVSRGLCQLQNGAPPLHAWQELLPQDGCFTGSTAAALSRAHEPGRVRPWRAGVARSVATPAGMAVLRGRWARRAAHG